MKFEGVDLMMIMIWMGVIIFQIKLHYFCLKKAVSWLCCTGEDPSNLFISESIMCFKPLSCKSSWTSFWNITRYWIMLQMGTATGVLLVCSKVWQKGVTQNQGYHRSSKGSLPWLPNLYQDLSYRLVKWWCSLELTHGNGNPEAQNPQFLNHRDNAANIHWSIG